MSPWIPDALRIDVGVLRLPMQIARNLTPGLLMIFVYSLFQDQESAALATVALPVVDEDERTAAAIRAALGEQHLYHDGELTIASLGRSSRSRNTACASRSTSNGLFATLMRCCTTSDRGSVQGLE